MLINPASRLLTTLGLQRMASLAARVGTRKAARQMRRELLKRKRHPAMGQPGVKAAVAYAKQYGGNFQ